MAKREYSNGLQHLKFMQRAKHREEAVKKAEEEAAVADDSHWVVPASVAASGRRCVVIMEGDPKPGALLGRMSFQNCNGSVDKLVEEAEATHKRRFSAAKERAEAASSATNESLREARGGSRDGDDSTELTTEAEKDAQNKKPKIGGMQNSPAGVGGSGWQSQGRNDNKPWQGWRGQGDYRLLKPPVKR